MLNESEAFHLKPYPEKVTQELIERNLELARILENQTELVQRRQIPTNEATTRRFKLSIIFSEAYIEKALKKIYKTTTI